MSDNNNSDYSRPKNGTRSPEVLVTQSNSGSNSGMFLIIAAVVVALAAYFIYTNNWNLSPRAPSVTQNTVVVPAPATAPVVATPDATTAPIAPKASTATPDAAKPVQ